MATPPATRPPRPASRPERPAPTVADRRWSTFVALVVVAVTLGPVLYVVLGGFRTNGQLAESPAGLPNPWVLENYQRVLTSASFWRYALNSHGRSRW